MAKLRGDWLVLVIEACKKLSVKTLISCFRDVFLLQVSGHLAGHHATSSTSLQIAKRNYSKAVNIFTLYGNGSLFFCCCRSHCFFCYPSKATCSALPPDMTPTAYTKCNMIYVTCPRVTVIIALSTTPSLLSSEFLIPVHIWKARE